MGRVWLAGVGWVLGLFLVVAVPAAGGAGTLTVGSLSASPGEEIARFLPFARYLAVGLADHGVEEGRVVVARSHWQMAERLQWGEVDLFIDSSLSALLVQRLSGGEFLARRWKKGIAQYQGVIFVGEGSPVAGLGDLVGRTIAFEEPFSSSGYLLPVSELRKAGLRVARQESGAGPGEGVINYRFSGQDENTLLWVLHGRVEAGAMGDGKFARLTAPLGRELRVIHRTATIPYHVVVVRPGLEEPLRNAIHRRLLAMDGDPDGARVLQEFEGTTRFDDIPPDQLQALTRREVELPANGGANRPTAP